MPPLAVPTIPDTAPFTPLQRDWLNGYLAGLFSGRSESAAAPALGEILFLFGTQTGGSETLCRKFAKEAGKLGFTQKVTGMADFAGIDFPSLKRLVVVTSTYGDGEMPDNAQAFWDHLNSAQAPSFAGVEFAVLALGDRNYAQFCEAGKKFDTRLAALEGKRVHDRVDCDVDFESASEEWIRSLLPKWSGTPASAPAAQAEEAPEAPGLSKSNPFVAKLVSARAVSGPRSEKETRHVDISLEGAEWSYEVGDALGVWPKNCPALAAEILSGAGLSGEEPVVADGKSTPLRVALIEHFDLRPYLEKPPASPMSAGELVSGLKKIQPRLYSISSSPKAHPGCVNLTVGVVRYKLGERACKGVCSTYLTESDRLPEGGDVRVFIHRSPGFRLPADPAAPVIMVGPGTGIAPFRAFLEERRATGATGANWLFFGDRTRANDFLYEEELLAMREEGVLTRLDLAFSRDQTEKIYVQDRMLAEAAELWSWFGRGACFYVCGDASRMAKDVDAALRKIAEIAGGLASSEAEAWVAELKKQKRYMRDVY